MAIIVLSSAQQETIQKITTYASSFSYQYEDSNGNLIGETKYLTDEQIKIAVQIVYKESSLDQNAGRANGDGDAIGTFQYQEKPWSERHSDIGDGDRTKFENQLVAFFNDYADVIQWYDEDRIIPDVENPGANIPTDMKFDEYAYVKHHDGRSSKEFEGGMSDSVGWTYWNTQVTDDVKTVLDGFTSSVILSEKNSSLSAYFSGFSDILSQVTSSEEYIAIADFFTNFFSDNVDVSTEVKEDGSVELTESTEVGGTIKETVTTVGQDENDQSTFTQTTVETGVDSTTTSEIKESSTNQQGETVLTVTEATLSYTVDGETEIEVSKTDASGETTLKATVKDGELVLEEGATSNPNSEDIELNIHLDLQAPFLLSMLKPHFSAVYEYSISDTILTTSPDLEPFVNTTTDAEFVSITKEIFVPAIDSEGNNILDEQGNQVVIIQKVPGYITIDEKGNSVTAWADNTYDIKRDSIKITKDANGIVDVTLNFDGAEHPVDVGSIGSVFGNTIGSMIASDNQLAQIGTSTLFSVIGANLADSLAIATTEATIGDATDQAFSDFGMDLKGASISAVQSAISSLIVAELVSELGLGDGENAKFASSVGGAYVTAIVANGFDVTTVDYSKVNVSNIVAAYVGKRIGEEVYQTQTSGGAIGASVGSSIGAIIGSPFLPPLGSAIGAAIGHIVGGFIGDLFGSPPKSGADVLYNFETGEFYATNVWQRHGGSKSAAEGLATFAANKLNFVVEMIGGDVDNQSHINAGTYGLRKNKTTYKGTGGSHRFSDAGDMITYGVMYALDELEIAGGNVFVKRAIYNAVDQAISEGNIGSSTLDEIVGSTSFALDYAMYVENSGEINAIMGAEPNSVFTQTWVAVLKMASSLGWTKRQESDHFGGWQHLIEKEYAQDVVSETGNKKLGLYNAVSFSYSDNERGITINNQVGPDTPIHDYVGGGAKTEFQFANVTAELTQEEAQAQLDEALSNEPQEITEDDDAVQVLEKIRVAAVITGNDKVIDADGNVIDDGVDIINSGDQGNDVLGGSGNDILTGGKLADWLIGGDGNDTLNAGGGNNNALFGEEGGDTLNGAEGSDWLDGGAGTDTLHGNGGDDILDGGTGNDNLHGGAGNDTYLFKRGDGEDTISDVDAIFDMGYVAQSDFTGAASIGTNGEIGGGSDTIEFGENISLNHINIYLDETHDQLVITLLDNEGEKTADTLTIQNWSNAYHRIERLQFADGQAINLSNIESFITGDSANNVITGTDGADFIHGGAGNDEISALGGDDVAIGGLGNDNVSGDDDNDLVVGGDGNDNLYGGAGNDIVSGDSGNDTLAGGIGDDILSGGMGDDVINTGAGDDTVIFGRGDGHDTLVDAYAGEEVVAFSFVIVDGVSTFQMNQNYSWDGAGNTLAIWDSVNSRFSDGFVWQADESTGNSQLVHLSSADTGDTIIDLGQDTLELKVGVSLESIRVLMDNGDLIIGVENPFNTEQNFAELNDTIRIKGWVGAAAASIETLRVFGINDIDLTSISTFQGGDNEGKSYLGGDGIDWITSGGGQDNVHAGSGDDIVSGGGSNDIIEGGAGADVLFGGHGFDTLSYATSNDAVHINLSATLAENRAMGGDAQGDLHDGFENLTGSVFNDTLTGDDQDNVINAGKGNDVVSGGLGDDTYFYTRGDGTLLVKEAGIQFNHELAGLDTLEFGDGINPADVMFTQSDNLADLEIRIQGTDDLIILQDWYLSASNKVEYILFASGGTIDISHHSFNNEVTASADWLQGTSEADTILGQAGNDILIGGAGDDILNGGDHDDILLGGTGSDILNGGDGSDTAAYYESDAAVTLALDNSVDPSGGTADGDTFTSIENVIGSAYDDSLSGDRFNNIINGGRGDDDINGGAGSDTLQGGEGVDTIYGESGTDTISGHAGDDFLYGGQGYDLIGGGEGVDTIEGNGGEDTIWGGTGEDIIDAGADNDLVYGGLDGDTINGQGGDDDIRGGQGNDIIDGGAGNDALFGESGIDTIKGGGGDDFITGGEGNDILSSASGNNVIRGGEGNDSITGGSGNDTLLGDDGDDTIIGNEGDDFLIGGAGNDLLDGGTGTDYYVFSGDFGQDTVSERIAYSSVEDRLASIESDDLAGAANDSVTDIYTQDELIFTGISAQQLWFEKDGQDLIISVIGTNNQVTVKNFSRFRINADESGQVSDQIQQALLGMSAIKSLQVDGATLSLDAVSDMVEVMAQSEKPNVQADLPTQVAQIQESAWQASEISALESRVDHAPVLSDREFTLTEDTTLFATDSADNADPLIATDTNPNELLTYEIVREPSNGIFTIDPVNGHFSFKPDDNFYGQVLAKIKVTDSSGLSDTATVTFIVEPDNDPADVVYDIHKSTAEDESILLNLEFSDSDNTFSDYTVSYGAGLEKGTLENHNDGTFTYKPNADVNGSDLFTILLTDPSGLETVTNVRIDVTAVNDKPEILDTSTLELTLDEGGEINGKIDAFDADIADTLTYELISYFGELADEYENGVLTFTPNSQGEFSIDYDSNPEFFGGDKYKVRVTDSSGVAISFAETIVNVNVNKIDDEPTGINWIDGAPTISEGDISTVALRIGQVEVEDVDGYEALSFEVSENLTGLTVTIDDDGYVWVSSPDFEINQDTNLEITIGLKDNRDPGNQFLAYTQPLAVTVLNENSGPIVNPDIGDSTQISILEFSAWRPEFNFVEDNNDWRQSAESGEEIFHSENYDGNFLDDLFLFDVTDVISYEVVAGGNSNLFKIDPDSNRLVFSNNTETINYEALGNNGLAAYEIDIVAVNQKGGRSDSVAVTINVDDVDEHQIIAEKNSGDVKFTILQPDFELMYEYREGIEFSVIQPRTIWEHVWDVYDSINNTVVLRDHVGGLLTDYIASTGYSVFSTLQYDSGSSIEEIELIQVGAIMNYSSLDMYLRKDHNYFYYNENNLDPITFDLGNDGLDFSPQGSVLFDVDSDGDLEATAWVGANDGMLALDRNQNGIIDNGSEISFVADLEGANTDLEGLAGFDSNQDGVLDANDARFNEFLVWQDANQNGISEANELKTLTQVGIQSINLTPTPNGESVGVAGVNLVNTSSFTFSDGTSAVLGDVRFMFDEINANDPQYAELVEGTNNSETMVGTFGTDNIAALEGDDIVFASEGNDLVHGNAGNDLLSGGKGDDQLYGDAGDDDIRGGMGNDIISGGEGADQISANEGDDQVSGGDGDDIIDGNEGSDALFGDAGGDTINGGDGSDYLDGGLGNDTLIGNAGSDFIFGDSGDDFLVGGTGNDTLVGGVGNDVIDGTSGLNNIVFNRGDGIDTVAYIDGSYDLFITGIEVQQVRFSTDGSNLMVNLGEGINGEDQIVFSGFEQEGLFAAQESGILTLNSITFEDGTVWDRQQLLDSIYLDINPAIIGTQGDDNLLGTDGSELIEAYSGDDVVNAGDGNDEVYGYKGDDTLHGGTGNDILDGGSDNDVLYGDTDNDQLYGQGGSDTLDGGAGDDILYGGDDTDTLTGGTGNDTLLGQDGNDALQGNDGDDILAGGAGIDDLSGGDGNDELRGGADNDSLSGGIGDDQLSGDEGDDVISGDQGSDILSGGTGNDQLFGGDGVDMLIGESGNDELSGGAGNDYLFGDEGNDILEGGQGEDLLVGSVGDDTYFVDNINDKVIEEANEGSDTLITSLNTQLNNDFENIENLTLVGAATSATGNQLDNTIKGNAGGNQLTGLAGNDELIGGAGNDSLDGGTGSDVMSGGLGDDIYLVDNQSDQVIEDINQGTDTVVSSVDLTLSANVENLVLTGNAVSATGNELDNLLQGNALDNMLSGEAGNDEIEAGSGNDTLMGGLGDDTLYAGEGNDALTGGQGSDTLYGGTGDDTYYVDDANDAIVENTNQGNDTVVSSVDHTLAQNVDNLTLTGSAITATGNQLDNNLQGNELHNTLLGEAGNDYLQGNAGNDTLDGGLGDDVLVGGAGDDTYRVDSLADVVTENANEGIDTLLVSIDLTLTDNVENLTLVGSATSATGNELNNRITGNNLNNTLMGLAGNDELTGGTGNDNLDGGTGSDVMAGGLGDDVYSVDSQSDQVIEDINQGTDTIVSSVDLTLASNVENLELTGDAVSGTGNALENQLQGNALDNTLSGEAGNDILEGEAGNDTLLGGLGDDTLHGGTGNDALSGGQGNDSLYGGTGDDTYYVDDANDVIVENTNQGNDTVVSSVDHVLAQNVENLTLTGNAITATGNQLDNNLQGNELENTLLGETGNDYLQGNAGNDTLDGGLGDDVLVGGTGDDTYHVDSLADVVTENASEGIDTLVASIDMSLFDNVENLTLIGTAIQGSGNELNNLITGNDINNILMGLAGNDELIGGTGNDNLDGGTGSDVMAGALGDDIYLVDNQSDQVIESLDQGADTVVSSVDLTLVNNVENLVLTGNAVSGTGNELDNLLQGNELDNRLSGEAGDDTLEGAAGNDTLLGGAGNDNLYGGLGNDLLDGLSGNDTLVGGAGDDVYVVDSLNDQVIEQAQEGNDTIVSSIDLTLAAQVENLRLSGDAILAMGNALDNTLTGNQLANQLLGDAGNDRLIGLAGNDILDGGAGTDTLVFNRGDGQDTVIEATGSYQIELHGITRDEVTLTVVDDELVLDLGQGDSLSFAGFDILDSEDSLAISQIQFVNDGVTETLNRDEVSMWLETLLATHTGDENNNWMFATHEGDRMHGFAGNDVLVAFKGDDVLLGGKGNDALTGGQGNDRLLGGSGDDILFANTGDDSLNGGTGNDALFGGVGSDTYTFAIGDGKDWLLDGLGTDRIQFTGDVQLEDIWLERVGHDLVIHYSENDQITVELGFTNGILGIDEIAIGDQVHLLEDMLASGQVIMLGDDKANYLNGGWENNTLRAGAGNDVLSADVGDDTLFGETGNDRLYGGVGNDVLVGGKGDDLLDGGYGSDTYLIEKGDGHDLIVNRDRYSEDQLVFAEGITLSDLSFEQDRSDLVINITGGTDSVTINKWFKGDNYQVENWVVEGVSYNRDEVAQLIQAMSSFAPSTGIDEKSIKVSQDSAFGILAASVS